MRKKYNRCSKCDKLLVLKKKKSYGNVCETCVAKELYEKNLITPVVQEEWFEDDPRAIKEVEYGRVSRNATHVFSRNILDDIG